MADDDTDDAATVTAVANEVQRMYLALQSAAGNIAALVQLGTATCENVAAYNAWALAIHNTQVGMLNSLRSGGEPNVPGDPPQPMLFATTGADGNLSLLTDCGAGIDISNLQQLSGLLGAAMAPSVNVLPAGSVIVVNGGDTDFTKQAPTWKQMIDIQNAQANLKGARGLGNPLLILIVIAAVTVGISVAIAAIASYLKTSAVTQANTTQVRSQVEAYSNYTATLLSCQQTCINQGGTASSCNSSCASAVTPPSIQVPGITTSWGTLQWVGFSVLFAGGLFVAYKMYERHEKGLSLIPFPHFEIPESAHGL